MDTFHIIWVSSLHSAYVTVTKVSILSKINEILRLRYAIRFWERSAILDNVFISNEQLIHCSAISFKYIC